MDVALKLVAVPGGCPYQAAERQTADVSVGSVFSLFLLPLFGGATNTLCNTQPGSAHATTQPLQTALLPEKRPSVQGLLQEAPMPAEGPSAMRPAPEAGEATSQLSLLPFTDALAHTSNDPTVKKASQRSRLLLRLTQSRTCVVQQSLVWTLIVHISSHGVRLPSCSTLDDGCGGMVSEACSSC